MKSVRRNQIECRLPSVFFQVALGLTIAIGGLPSAPAVAQTAWGQRHLLCTYGSTHKDAYATPQEIISACDRLLADDPDNIWSTGWRSGRAYALSKLGKCDEAIAELDGLLKETLRAWVLRSRGDIVADCKKDFQSAIVDYNRAINLDPADADYLVSRANSYYRLGRVREAKADYDRAVQLKPDDSSPIYDRARFYADIEDYDSAKRDFAEAERIARPLREKPWLLASVFNARALMWRDMGDYDRAMIDADNAVKTFPKNGLFRANRGEIWRLKGDLNRALTDQTFGVKNWSKENAPLILRGTTLRFMGRYREALRDYDLALSRCPGCLISVSAHRGLTYEKMGDTNRARAEFETAVNAGRGIVLTDLLKSSFESAEARLAALDSGAPQPLIPAVPGKPQHQNSVPTPAVKPQEASPAPTSSPGRRVALVIGNSNYALAKLPNPIQDADAIAGALKRIGFATVTLIKDAKREELVNALRAFADEAEKSDWAIVYYAGHGVEMGGVNFLLPVDAKLATDRDVQFEAVPLDQILASIEQSRKLQLVFLDACRDNPFLPQMRRTPAPAPVALHTTTAGAAVATRSVGRGLGRVDLGNRGRATLVFYSAKHGQTALDGDGANSPFAVALAQRLATPGVEINKLLRLVRDDVMEATAGRQEPYTYGSLPGSEDFFFVAKP